MLPARSTTRPPPGSLRRSRRSPAPWAPRWSRTRRCVRPPTPPSSKTRSFPAVEAALLAWFEVSGRDLPWRRTHDPYSILVSEVMLQQTQVDRVVPRWHAWLERWPTVDALAAASPAEVIVEWQGLGYNRRAVSLHGAAQHVAVHGWP